MYNDFSRLVGRKVLRVFMNEDYLKFETDKGPVLYIVDGGCCSHSYFHDFIGVRKLLENGVVKSTRSIELDPEKQTYSKTEKREMGYGEVISLYGFEIVTENATFSDQTSVLSFRNKSNGWYGGSLVECEDAQREVQPEITDDVMEAAPSK